MNEHTNPHFPGPQLLCPHKTDDTFRPRHTAYFQGVGLGAVATWGGLDIRGGELGQERKSDSSTL